MNTIWILIIIIASYAGGLAIDHIEFIDQKACTSAEKILKGQTNRNTIIMCVPKDSGGK